MGIDYKAAIVVGLERGNLNELENLEDMIDQEELEVCAPYYDGDGDDSALVGYFYKVSGNYQASEFQWDITRIDKLLAMFKEKTGYDGKIWLSPLGG